MADDVWFLEGIAADGTRRVVPIRVLPMRVGRDVGNELVLDALGLSRHHATLDVDASGALRLTDAGSTNGTYVNRVRLHVPCRLAEGDVVHFGHNVEFRLGRDVAARVHSRQPPPTERTVAIESGLALSQHFVQHERPFLELLRGHGLSAAAQPIVGAEGGRVVAYELLGRCTHPLLPASPVHLFRLAALLDREAELSAAFRTHGVQAIAPRLQGAKLFVNAHPSETFTEGFLSALRTLTARPGAPQLVVEVHESAVVDVQRMADLAARLAEMGVDFAYDDFGAGQARLNELGDVPAHFVKFDMGLVHRIHEATERKQRVVRDLVRLVLDLGSVPLAEGVELEAEAAVCREMGFRLIQGFLTGRPQEIAAP
ncbi:MAG: EAL domain-containing protein [Rubrivivax sp.]|jgi:EAL domain-containing protein (putative c-di-GMP-specific phosphodiesterase class I)|nr:EAL domain-containing protein [Rubrivivax sp.]